MIITAEKGKVFRRKHDGFIMSDTIILGYDFSTGVKRQDLPEYYEQVDDETPNDEKLAALEAEYKLLYEELYGSD
jgi:hypothetical protein